MRHEKIEISPDLAVRVMIELGQMRARYVHDRVDRARDRSDLTRKQVDALEREEYQRWNEYHPALKELWFDVLQARGAA